MTSRQIQPQRSDASRRDAAHATLNRGLSSQPLPSFRSLKWLRPATHPSQKRLWIRRSFNFRTQVPDGSLEHSWSDHIHKQKAEI
jgi:hypothetical protein